VHSLDGYDEISLTAPFKVTGPTGERIYNPEELGWKTASQQDLWGGATVADAAKIFDNLLDGNATSAQENSVVANSAFALVTLDPKLSIDEATALAVESIHSGAARKVFNKFCEINR
ncbi:MAG: anthranilate phosphoribosyltransferase, partial [Muribaculaceae bacterium]|nr:anthranilate phosphoribosyltransferase [Muribaculaceae bacterium]